MNGTRKDAKRLPDSELEVMMAVWQGKVPAHTGDILQRLAPEKTRRLQSVQVFLGRLVEKGFLRCEKIGRLNYYTPLVDEESYRSLETDNFIGKLYGSSPARLVASLVSDSKLSREDLEEIRQLLEKRGE